MADKNNSNQSNLMINDRCKFYWIEFIGYFYVQTLICFTGFWLNLACVLVFRKRYFRRIVHRLMSALALFDLLNLLIMMPQGLIRCSQYPNTYFPICQDPTFNKIRKFIYHSTIYFGFAVSNIMELTSNSLLIVITWERYQAMRGYCQFNIKSTTYASKIATVIFVICIIINLPFFFVQHIAQDYVLTKHFDPNSSTIILRNVSSIITVHTKFGESYFYYIFLWIRMGLFPIIILLILILFSILLVKVTRRYFKKYTANLKTHHELQMSLLQSTPPASNLVDKRQKIELTLTFLLIILIALFIVGQCPQILTFRHLYEKLIKNCQPSSRIECCYSYKVYRMISVNSCLLTYSMPFFLYFKFDRTFERAFLEIFCGKSVSAEENSELMLNQETFNLSTNHIKGGRATISSSSHSHRETVTNCCLNEHSEHK